MLGTFPKVFSAVATSQEYFPKWQPPKCASSQAETSKVFLSRSALPSVCSSHGARPLAHLSRSDRPPFQPAAPQRAYPNLWEVAAWESAHLGSCHLVNCHLGSRPCEIAFGNTI